MDGDEYCFDDINAQSFLTGKRAVPRDVISPLVVEDTCRPCSKKIRDFYSNFAKEFDDPEFMKMEQEQLEEDMKACPEGSLKETPGSRSITYPLFKFHKIDSSSVVQGVSFVLAGLLALSVL